MPTSSNTLATNSATFFLILGSELRTRVWVSGAYLEDFLKGGSPFQVVVCALMEDFNEQASLAEDFVCFLVSDSRYSRVSQQLEEFARAAQHAVVLHSAGD